MATVRKWRGKICLAFLFRVSLFVSVHSNIRVYTASKVEQHLNIFLEKKNSEAFQL